MSLYPVPLLAGGGHGHPQGPRQVPAGEGRPGGALAGADVTRGGTAQRRCTPAPWNWAPPFFGRRGEDRASLCQHRSAWSTATAVLPWLSCPLLPSPVCCLLTPPSASPRDQNAPLAPLAPGMALPEGWVKAGPCQEEQKCPTELGTVLCCGTRLPSPHPPSLGCPGPSPALAPAAGGDIVGLPPAPCALSPLPCAPGSG